MRHLTDRAVMRMASRLSKLQVRDLRAQHAAYFGAAWAMSREALIDELANAYVQDREEAGHDLD